MDSNKVTTIKARAIYEDPNSKPLMKSDPPQGCLAAYRYHDGGRQYKIGEPWPELAIGEEVEIETTNHYVWQGTVEARIDEDTLFFRPIGQKVAMPLPPVVEGQLYRLPWISGDAWSRKPEAGTVLMIQGKPYKVIGKPKPRRGYSDYDFNLLEVDPKDYATRPGQTVIKDKCDPNPTSLFYCQHNVGRIVKIGEEFLHVTKVERRPYGGGEGREIYGYNTFGIGQFVTAEKAAKLEKMWQKADKIRSLEQSLKVAGQDLDYGGNPEAIPTLKAQLEVLRAEK